MEYKVGRVRNADQERTRLNEILRDIQAKFNLTDTQLAETRRQIAGLTGVDGIVTSVNGATGDVTITIQSIGGVPVTRQINTTNSLTGGGDLSANRTLQLVGDTATPGPNQVYGTDGTGARGWKADPAGGGGQVDTIVAGDGIDVDSTDPVNPEVSARLSTDVGNTISFGTDGGLFTPQGVEDFIDLDDTPASYSGASGNYVRVNTVPDGLEFRSTSQVLSDIGAVPATRTVSAGDGLTGGGDLSANRTISMGTPSTLTTSTTNQATGTTHTHAISIAAADIGAVPTSRTITAGTGLTGGGDLSANRTISLADTAVTPGTYAPTAAQTATFTVDAQGRITAASSNTIDIAAGQVTSGSFGVSRGGTGLTSLTTGNYIRAASSSTFEQRTPSQVLGDVGGVPTTRTITAGTGLSGGGDLSADRTINLANTAVTPGTYGGNSGVTTSFTVDAQGRITSAAQFLIEIDAAFITGQISTSQIANNAVTNDKLRDSAALSVIGRSANSTGDPADIAAGTDGHVLRRSGTTLGFGTLASGAFASNTVSRAALVNGTALTVIGRSANSTGAVADISAGSDHQVLRRSGTTLGFGAIALNQANAVTGQLPAANVATGTSGAAIPLLNGNNTHSGLETFTGGHYINGGAQVKVVSDISSRTLDSTDNAVIAFTILGALTMNLPASPPSGQVLRIKRVGNNNVTIARNGNNINGAAADLVLTTNGQSALLIYVGTDGWFTF